MTLGEILRILQKRYWIILAGALIAGIAAAVLSFVWPPRYESGALLLITKLRPSVTLDARYQTVAEENVVNLSVQEEQVRRQTLVALATGDELVSQVRDLLKTQFPAGEWTQNATRGMVEVGTSGNLISIVAKAGNPEQAAAIANAWASAYEETVNQLYSTTSPSGAEIGMQVEEALTRYHAAQQELQAFLKASRENELRRQIDQKQRVLANLQAAYLTAAHQQAAQLLARQSRTERLLLDVQSLRVQLAGASPSDPLTPGEQFGLFSVEGLAFAQGEVLSTTLELAPGWQGDAPLSAGQAITHLERLADTLKADSATTQASLDALLLRDLVGDDLLLQGADERLSASIVELQSAISDLQSQLEQETIRKTDLTNARDIAQQSHLTLVRKATEVQISSEITGVEIQIASSAQAPEEPAFPRPLLTIVLGLLAGALAGLVFIFLIELWPRGAGAGSSRPTAPA